MGQGAWGKRSVCSRDTDLLMRRVYSLAPCPLLLAPRFWRLIARILLLDLILRQLLTLHALQELLHAVASGVVGTLGGEYHMHALDVVGDGERLGGARTLGVQADLERAEAVELYALGVLQLVAHGLHQLVQHGEDIGLLHGTVALHDLRQLTGVNHRHGYGTGIPFAAALGSYTLVLMQSEKY